MSSYAISTPENLQVEEIRRSTFDLATLPDNCKITPAQFAGAGFYYLGHRDYVKCAFCPVAIGQFEPHDDIYVEHITKTEGKCPFLKHDQVVNIKFDKFPNINAFIAHRARNHQFVTRSGAITHENEQTRITEQILRKFQHDHFALANVRYKTFRANERNFNGLQDTEIDLLVQHDFFYSLHHHLIACSRCGLFLPMRDDEDYILRHHIDSPDCTNSGGSGPDFCTEPVPSHVVDEIKEIPLFHELTQVYGEAPTLDAAVTNLRYYNFLPVNRTQWESFIFQRNSNLYHLIKKKKNNTA